MARPPLKGLAWDHPRGHDSLAMSNESLVRATGVSVSWTARSLQQFGDDTPDDDFVAYDIVSIDHPHVAAAAERGNLVPLDVHSPAAIDGLARQSVGPSHDSYSYAGHQWALATDAAAQVSAFRPDLVDRAPLYWPEVLSQAGGGTLLWPYKPVDAISTLLTLCAQLAPAGSGAPFLEPGVIEEAVGMLVHLAASVPSWCAAANPIDIAEALCGDDGFTAAVALYGYSNYSRPGFRPHTVVYQDIPSFDGLATGSVLGGAGLAVSSRSDRVDDAVAAAVFLSGADCQRGEYVDAGGQPGNLLAWKSQRVNEASAHFFANTLRTLERSWVRPRHPGWPAAQLAASHILVEALVSRSAGGSVAAALRAALAPCVTAVDA